MFLVEGKCGEGIACGGGLCEHGMQTAGRLKTAGFVQVLRGDLDRGPCPCGALGEGAEAKGGGDLGEVKRWFR